jgi:hypothetical protein
MVILGFDFLGAIEYMSYYVKWLHDISQAGLIASQKEEARTKHSS